MRHKFTYSLVDTRERTEIIDDIESTGIKLTGLQKQNLGKPFHEVILSCEIDERGNVAILGIAPTN